MEQFIAHNQNVEVNGFTVLSVVNGLGVFKRLAFRLLEANGIKDPQPDCWYSQQAWLDTFQQIALKVGIYTLYQIGTKIPESAIFPSEIDSVHKGLASIDLAYNLNHRGGEIGIYGYTKTGEYSAKMTCDNPYPCDFDMGLIFAMIQKFAAPKAIIKIDHEQGCRKEGAANCNYLVSW